MATSFTQTPTPREDQPDASELPDGTRWNVELDDGTIRKEKVSGDQWVLVDEEVGSVSAEVLGNTILHAAQYDGEKGVDKIQAALNDLGAEHGTIIVEGVPDDLSGLSAATESSGWLFDKTLLIPSNTMIHFQNVYVFLESGVDDNIIRNKTGFDGTNDRNTNIHIFGPAVLDGNGSNQTRLSNQYRNNGIHLHKVDHFSLKNFTIGPTNAFAVVPENVNQSADSDTGVIENITLRQDDLSPNQDGVHVIGPYQSIYANGIQGTVGDDAVVADTAGSEIDSAFGDGGDGNLMVVSDINITNLSSGAALRTIPEAGATLEKLHVSNINYTGVEYDPAVIKLGWVGTTEPTKSEHKNININGVNATGSGSLVHQFTSMKNVTLSDFEGTHSQAAYDESGSAVENVTLRGWNSTQTADAPANSISPDASNFKVIGSEFSIEASNSRSAWYIDGDVDDFVFDDVTIDGFDTGINIDGNHSIDPPARFDNLTFENVSTKWSLDSKLGVLIDGKSPRTNYAGLPTYTGDGTTGRDISLGFAPSYVALRGSDGTWYDVHGDFGTAYQHSTPTGELSISADGFTVGDNGGDADPNTNGETYDLYYEL